MKFDSSGDRVRNTSTKASKNRGKMTKRINKFESDGECVQEYSLVGLQDKLVRSKKFMRLSKFSYYDPEKKICKLCYESINPTDTPNGLTMVNTLDGENHRVWIGSRLYCKMAKGGCTE